MKDPAFLFYANDFTSGTIDYSAEEVGCYIRLLCYQHQHGFIPSKVEKLMRICGIFCKDTWSDIWDEVGKKFELTDGKRLVNQRLNQEVNKRSRYGLNKTISGSLAGLISANKVSKKIARRLKQDFDIQDFTKYEDKIEAKKMVKQWFNQRLTIYENENEVENRNENKDEEIKVEPIEKFKNEIEPFVKRYGKETCNDFFAYWTEPNEFGKMRFQLQEFFHIGRRLGTWVKRAK